MSILDKIVENTIVRIEEQKKIISLNQLKKELKTLPKKNLEDVFKKDKTNIISEIKFASPSEGLIREASKENAKNIAKEYLDNNATALSILTEPNYFSGSITYLKEVRNNFPNSFILQKDFFVDEYQFYQANVLEASSILLIVSSLGIEKTKKFLDLSNELGLKALVEVHDKEELKIALELNAEFIGINNRNLKNMQISLDTSKELSKLIEDKNITLISESGLKNGSELKELKKYGFSGFLIGSCFMKSDNAGLKLKEFLENSYEN